MKKRYLLAAAVLLLLLVPGGSPSRVSAGSPGEGGQVQWDYYLPPYLRQLIRYVDNMAALGEENQGNGDGEYPSGPGEPGPARDPGGQGLDISPGPGAGQGDQVILHRVKKGETVGSIARHYRSSIDIIAYNNQIRDIDRLVEGETLKITRDRSVIYQVQEGDSLWSVARKFKSRWGEIKRINKIEDPGRLPIGTTLVIPLQEERDLLVVSSPTPARETRDPVEGTREQSPGQLPGPGLFAWPAQGRISSPYGPREGGFHYGLDIALPTGHPLKAARGGEVELARWVSGYGRTVIIDHGGGWKTLYAHASRLEVREGERVNQGQVIALAGETGNATGPHLHLEIIKDGQRLDPLPFLE